MFTGVYRPIHGRVSMLDEKKNARIMVVDATGDLQRGRHYITRLKTNYRIKFFLPDYYVSLLKNTLLFLFDNHNRLRKTT